MPRAPGKYVPASVVCVEGCGAPDKFCIKQSTGALVRNNAVVRFGEGDHDTVFRRLTEGTHRLI